MLYRNLALVALALSSAAQAHVKWFEAYEVSQEPFPSPTLALPSFWLAGALVLIFFVATTLLERTAGTVRREAR
jgi:hypothetical protein